MSDQRRYFDSPFDLDPWGRRRRQAIDPRTGRPLRRDAYGRPIEPQRDAYGRPIEPQRAPFDEPREAVAEEPAPAPEPQVADTGERVRELEDQVVALQAEIEQREQENRRLAVRAAEAENEIESVKARIRREASREVEQRKRGILGAMLEVLDDLDRAIASARDRTGDRSLLQGIELVRQGFLRRLEQLGVEPAPAAGQRFDPQHHEAVSSVPVSDPDLRGTVVEVLREGYRIGDEVLRPAHVIVGV